MIYFDNAATSWPKPPGVVEAMVNFMEAVGANPGRAAHRRAVEAGMSAGPGAPLSVRADADMEARIRIPTVRQPVLPLKIEDIVESNDGGDS